MDTIEVTIPSRIHHLSQIITGFLLLKEQGWDVKLMDRSQDRDFPFYDLPVALVRYRDKQVIYDMWDGYQNPEGIKKGLEICDFYFKRSFSAEKNQTLFPEYAEKIYPLGLFYRVIHPQSPIQEPRWKEAAKLLMGRTPERYFVPNVFEGSPTNQANNSVKILFQTQLWNSNDPTLSQQANEERRDINNMRISILRVLRQKYGKAFIGGLSDTALSRSIAPDLIIPKKYTERKNYLKLVHSCDICIGSMGLHESIGGKTGEYVAAAKAIVNESLHYSLPGDFLPGQNYLPFTTAQECIDAVQQLVDSPDRRYAMQQANQQYYQHYLKPDILVKNTLDQIDNALAQSGKIM